MKTIKELKQVLDEKITNATQIIITPHIVADYDALASSVGLVHICKELGKESYILLEHDYSQRDKSIRKMFVEIKRQYPVIDMDRYLSLSKDSKDLLITTDVNKDYRILLKDYLDEFQDIIVIDHHDTDEHTISTPYQYINTKASSSSEIVANILQRYKIPYSKECASYLYAGIALDSNHFSKNIESSHLVAARLIKNGADMDYVNSLFVADFESDRKIQGLLDYSTFQDYRYGIAARKDGIIYTQAELAQAADQLLAYSGDIAFTIGQISQDMIAISGRSNGNIHVGEALSMLGGGGNAHSAATVVSGSDIEEVEKKLRLIMKPGRKNID